METIDKKIQEQLSIKRTVLFLLLFCVVCLVRGDWPFFADSVFAIFQYRATWAVFTAVMLLSTMAADGHLWLMRHPEKTQMDYYRRPRWWLSMLDFEFFGKTSAGEGQK
ncbi:hypothetical protein [Burkholderia cenocepacia]|uniref:hypothetical protein n=1 Tax=Burkholderia cenocepacia TaxID=95486 RepID=UPI000F5B744F|nr:hypothetical protein [Burkholderia cenocepacia]RQU49766.1 hypothetical protein DF143_36680 [Burkholderia cenocepacia]RQV32309.1 hypothetical protein DF033_36350 [Burkholderia cenocepacia]